MPASVKLREILKYHTIRNTLIFLFPKLGLLSTYIIPNIFIALKLTIVQHPCSANLPFKRCPSDSSTEVNKVMKLNLVGLDQWRSFRRIARQARLHSHNFIQEMMVKS
jgi:hypothetical protein